MSSKLAALTGAQRAELRPELQDVIEYRKSGLSLNHVIGCPLDCAYCVRHLFDNFEMKRPRRGHHLRQPCGSARNDEVLGAAWTCA